uniref:site-specific DNA-methyltransferase (adenine-specific) n=1 Tax=Caryophanon latum TaxID=33977 RepID=F1KC45_9BACL|nr:M.ClaI [Caryophanon latum]
MVKNINKKEDGIHYTAKELSYFMASRLKEASKKFFTAKNSEVQLLDPSCGDGELLKAAAKIFSEDNIKLIGVDTDEYAINAAQQYFTQEDNVSLFINDYLNLFAREEEQDLFNLLPNEPDSFFIEDGYLKPVDLILANPPYVRTQVMGADKSQILADKFNLKGKIDLYHVFLVAMTKHLKDNGIICVITSNRYLTTAGGKDIRSFLDANYEILEVIDLGDTKLFDAAVLPAIFIGRKKSPSENIKNDKVKCYRIYEETKKTETVIEKCESIYEILSKKTSGIYEANKKNYKVMSGILKVPQDPKELWVMASNEEKEWVEQIKKSSFCLFSDLFKVRVGIKTTADNVFINNQSEWEKLPSDIKPENEVLHSLISSDNIQKWTCNNSKISQKKILYTHQTINGKRQAIDLNEYEHTKNYLEFHKEQLSARTYLTKSKTRHWYEIWVPQEPNDFKKTKIVFPDISPEPKFSIDTNQYLVDGNCYWITLKESNQSTDLLYLAAAVANSDLMTRFHSIEFQNVLYAGRKRYLTQYVNEYVFPNPDSIYAKEIINLSKKLVSEKLLNEEIISIEKKLNILVEKCFLLH